MVQFSFNATQYEPRFGGADSMGPGKHSPVCIVESEWRPTKDSTPSDPRSMLCFKIADNVGASITLRLNLQNPNQQTVQIANNQLAAICAVTGRMGFNDTQELHNIPFMIEVAAQRGNEKYMEVVGVYFADGRPANSVGQPVQQQAQSVPFAPAAGAPTPATAPISTPAPNFPSSPPQPFAGQPASLAPAAAPPWARR